MEHKLLKRKQAFLNKGNKLHLAEVCYDLAEYYMQIGDYDLSKKEFKYVSEIYEELNKPILFARANRMIGEVCTSLAEFDEALKHENIHLGIARRLGNELEEQRALASIGRTYLIKAGDEMENVDSESLKLAHQFFRESLSVCEKLKNMKSSELADMKARLYLNIGIVYEHQGDFEDGKRYIKKSIEICRDAEIYDQLQLAYYTLGQLYAKMNNSARSINSFKLALEVANRLTDKIIPLCTTFLAYSDILIKIKEFSTAKQQLIKAYNLKTPNLTDRSTIEKNLKIVAAICQAEETLLVTPETEYRKRKELYERIGDGAAELRAFQVAIDYYLRMLESALANGEKGQDLIPVYISLAQTYKDDKQYKKAYHFFQEDYKITKDCPGESYKTLINIAQIMELMQSPVEDVVQVYISARKDAQCTHEINAEGKVLFYFIQYLKKMNRPYEELEKHLSALGYEASDSENESETPDIGDNIIIEDILAEDIESEDDNQIREKRRRGRQMRVKKNPLGETQLHLACKSDNIALITNLLAQNHPVNVRDNYGWLPIHEACNYGLVEVVELLINKGAFVNDRGGPSCKGVTPLHDACFNGHLEVIELLLNKGASPIAQTDTGYSPLDYLETWKNQNELDVIRQAYYDSIVERLITAMKKAGKSVKRNIINNDSAFYVESKNTNKQVSQRSRNTPNKSPHPSPQKSPISLRHVVDIEDDLNHPSCPNPSVDGNHSKKINSLKRNLSWKSNDGESGSVACSEYKRVMEGLRTRNPESSHQKPKKPNSPFVTEGEINENWLEDDLGSYTSKKRKRSSGQNSSSGVACYSDDEQENAEPNIGSRVSQMSLLDSGFVRNLSGSSNIPSSSQVTLVDKIVHKPYKRQQKLNSFVNNVQNPEYVDLTVSQSSENSFQNTLRPSVRSVLPVNVRIENKLLRIPVPAMEVNDLNVEWLANEASRRYYKQEGISPTLQLLTKEGAFLLNDDPLSIIFITETQAEEVQSQIISWNLPPIDKRYEEACNSLKIEQNLQLKKCLKDSQVTLSLNFARSFPDDDQKAPLFRALNRQNTLQHLDLANARIKDDGVALLCTALPSLIQLKSLNISENQITVEGIRNISQCMAEGNVLENLSDLNLSFNIFGADTLKYLSNISQKLKLRTLNLCGCGLPPDIFEMDINREVELNFVHLENFDISYNDLKSNDVIKFISFLNFNVLTNVNLSFNNNICESGITKAVAEKLRHCETINLLSLNLSQTKVNDLEIWELLRSVTKSNELGSLILSFNSDLTSLSLRRLLQHRPTFSLLCLLGCKNVLQYFDEFTFTSNPTRTVQQANPSKTLIISFDYKQYDKEVEILEQMWLKEWGEKAKVEQKQGKYMKFSVGE